MKERIKVSPRVAAAFIAFCVGLAMLLPVYGVISLYLAPKNGEEVTMEYYHSVSKFSDVITKPVRVHSDTIDFYAYGTWYTAEKNGERVSSSWPDVINVKTRKTHLMQCAAVLLLGVGPMMAAAGNVFSLLPQEKKRQPVEVTKQKTASGQQPPKKTTTANQPTISQAPPVQKQPPVQQQPPIQQPPVQQPKQPEKESKTTKTTSNTTLHVAPVKEVGVTFDSIAGYETTKKSMAFIVQCLSKPELLAQVGAKVPAGILLYGPPGTGKTLMAKAIADTAGVPFYSANASEFVNTWVGQGAENVRALYNQAKATAPSVVFIDELDAIGGQRGAGQNQEYRQTLNALLTEMDGLNKDSGVLTIAATNAYQELDSALVRPGRFDRKIMIPLPDYDDRLAIIKLYAAKRNMSTDISLEKLARDTAEQSGSWIATLFNEASIRAVMANRGIILQEDMDSAMMQMITDGEEAKTINQKDRQIAAYHEAGHAIILRLLAKEKVPKVTIVGSSSGSLGITLHSDEEGRQTPSLSKIRKLIVAVYGGRAAEELVFGKEEITTGAKGDISTASEWIREYMKYGAGETLLDLEAFTGQFGNYDQVREAKELSMECYQEALSFLGSHRDTLEKVAQALLDKDSLTEEDLEKLL